MHLSPDLLLDRIKLKSRMSWWRLSFFILLIISILIIFKSQLNLINKEKPFIAKINIKELITEDLDRDKKIKDLANNNNIKAVLININSPGGTEVGSEMLYSSLLQLGKNKPIIALMGTVAASGGYMIALAGDHILARSGTITGSIGVILQSFEVTELAKKLGINTTNFKSAPLKASPLPNEKLTPEIESAINSIIQDSYNSFVELVSIRRKLTIERTIELADGRIYTGRQAKELGLIDGLGGEEEAIKWLEDKYHLNSNLPIKEINVEKQENIIRDLLLFPKSWLNKLTLSNNSLLNQWMVN